jgi:hypothetical protein
MEALADRFYSITLAGKITDAAFYKAKACCKYLENEYPKNVKVEILCFFETQWEEYLKRIQNEKKGVFFMHKGTTILFYNETNYIGDGDAFTDFVLNEFRYIDKSSPIIYRKQATDAMKKMVEKSTLRQYVFMDVSINGMTQKVVIELFTEYAPKTCENFRKLCSGVFVNKKGEKLTYANSEFHRVVKGMYV